MSEFMPDDLATDDTKPPEAVGQWASRVLSDPANRAGVEAAFKAGRLSATMFEWLRDQSQIGDTRKQRTDWKTWYETATPTETEVMANISRRAMGQAEMPMVIPGTTTMLLFSEMLDTLREVYR